MELGTIQTLASTLGLFKLICHSANRHLEHRRGTIKKIWQFVAENFIVSL